MNQTEVQCQAAADQIRALFDERWPDVVRISLNGPQPDDKLLVQQMFMLFIGEKMLRHGA